MSLTSYRAAPPRVGEVGGPRLAFTPGPGSGGRGLAARRLSRTDVRDRRVGRGFGRPGGDLLFRALRRSTIGAEGFHGRVRDGIGCYAPRYGHQALPEVGDQRS